MISKKDLENLAELARIELKESQENKLLKDLESILKYFEELKEVDASVAASMIGGTFLENICRSDEYLNWAKLDGILSQFPKKENSFLRVPPVFSAESGSLPVRQAGVSDEE
ncbi:MAG: Asp-tRNA(Asn)/Glu-tRNA(Gln) amidotransferase subunit GatC [Patescibacteria group bacterium]|nr:Asp-tRNA(Asn)/Glu-tRNA(Gln) amidotransferase subunit GatC [Patescibacteria group bacterium]